jgi:hypothetical protein
MQGDGQEPPSVPGSPGPRDAAHPADPGSETPARSGPELRGAPRFTLLLRVAKLVVDGREAFCVIRDASTTGLKVKLFAPLPVHVELAVELANGDRHRAECVWTAGDHAGLHFFEPIELNRLLDEARDPGHRRQVRLRIALDGVLHSGGESVAIAFRDISQQGAAIECDKWLLLNELIRIETAILPPLYAKVRWRDHPRYGVIFEQTFHLEELARRCSGLPAPNLAAHPAPSPRASSGPAPRKA